MSLERLIAPARPGSIPHWHSEEEEIFVILEGSATLPSLAELPAHPGTGVEREQHALRPGHVVARPPGTGHLALVPRRR